MASRRRTKSLSETDARRDLISELPADVKDKILEHLPTRDAARTAVLSTQWKDVWLRHGRLNFDDNFFNCVRKYRGDKYLAIVNIINNILLFRAGPVKKFGLWYRDFIFQQSDLDRWCIYLSRNSVEELDLMLNTCEDHKHKYKLPVCILSCPTIKKLRLEGFLFGCPLNSRCIFPRVTSLSFYLVEFEQNVNGIVSTIPHLEELALNDCEGINNFEISAPKLIRLSSIAYMNETEWRWFIGHWAAIKTLCLSSYFLLPTPAAPTMLPTAMNLQVMKFYELFLAHGKHLTFATQLLLKSPMLCELEIRAAVDPISNFNKEVASRLLADPDGLIKLDLKMLKTVKIQNFCGFKLEMLFVKVLLSKSPALEKFDIRALEDIDISMVSKIKTEMLRFPRASQKAKLVMEYSDAYSIHTA